MQNRIICNAGNSKDLSILFKPANLTSFDTKYISGSFEPEKHLS